MFCEYIFGDRFHNIYAEIQSLYSYARENDLSDDFEIIESLLDICNGTGYGPHALIRLFGDIKESDADIRKDLTDLNEKYKSKTFSSLVSSCTQFTKESSSYDKMQSELNGCDTYYLDGDDFFAFVISDVEVEKNNVMPQDVNVNRLGHSFTCVGKKNIQTYKHPNKVLTMIYSGIFEENLGHVYHEDSWSTEKGSLTINEFYSADTLLEKSTKYPGVWMKDFSGIKPSTILCLDEATEWDYEMVCLLLF